MHTCSELGFYNRMPRPDPHRLLSSARSTMESASGSDQIALSIVERTEENLDFYRSAPDMRAELNLFVDAQ
jgi:hypothetical protein